MLERLLITFILCLIWGFVSYRICNKIFKWKSIKDWEKLEKEIEEDINNEK